MGFTAPRRVGGTLTGTDTSGRVTWQDGWHLPPLGSKAPGLGNPDLIVSAPPAHMPTKRASYELDGKRVVLNDTADSHVLLTALHLTDDGEAFFIVPNAFLFRTGGRRCALGPCRSWPARARVRRHRQRLSHDRSAVQPHRRAQARRGCDMGWPAVAAHRRPAACAEPPSAEGRAHRGTRPAR